MKTTLIKYNSEMVNATLQGLKTNTRRALDVRPYQSMFHPRVWHWDSYKWTAAPNGISTRCDSLEYFIKLALDNCKYGKVGDRLWVQEAFGYADYPDGAIPQERESIFYRADYHDDPHGYDGEISGEAYRKWLPPSAMPRRISRITQEITGMRVERLQDISESDADAEAEGIEILDGIIDDVHLCRLAKLMRIPATEFRVWFRAYWESIYGEGSWDANPLVFVIGTKVIE